MGFWKIIKELFLPTVSREQYVRRVVDESMEELSTHHGLQDYFTAANADATQADLTERMEAKYDTTSNNTLITGSMLLDTMDSLAGALSYVGTFNNRIGEISRRYVTPLELIGKAIFGGIYAIVSEEPVEEKAKTLGFWVAHELPTVVKNPLMNNIGAALDIFTDPYIDRTRNAVRYSLVDEFLEDKLCAAQPAEYARAT